MTQEPLRPAWEGQFDSFSNWVAYATSRLGGRPNAVCFDAKGRRCLIGKDFMRARDEDAFPVRFFWDMEPDPVPAELDKWQTEADKLAQGMQSASRLIGHLVHRFTMIEDAFEALIADPSSPIFLRPPHGPLVPSLNLNALISILAATREDIAALMPASSTEAARVDDTSAQTEETGT